MTLRKNALALVSVLVLSCGIAATGALAAEPRILSLTGTGRVVAEPDMATLTAGVVSEADTARAALSDNTARMTAVIDAFKQAGIPAKDLQTANFSVQPRYFHERTDTGTKPPRIVGYTVQNQVVVTVRDLSVLGAVLDKSVDVGANTISGPVFDIADKGTATDEARRQASADALHKAELYAEALGVTLGPIQSISEMDVSVPRPMLMRTAAVPMAAEAAVPIEGGEIDLTAQVNVTWTLADQ